MNVSYLVRVSVCTIISTVGWLIVCCYGILSLNVIRHGDRLLRDFGLYGMIHIITVAMVMLLEEAYCV
jgi:hypothetical protein